MIIELVIAGLACLLAGGFLNAYISKDKEPKTPKEKLLETPKLLEETGYAFRVAPTKAGSRNILALITSRKHNVHDPATGENRTKLFLEKPDGSETWEWMDVYNKVTGGFMPNVVADGDVFVSMMKTLNQDDDLNNLAWELSPPKVVNHMKQKANDADIIYSDLNRMKNKYMSLHQEYKAVKGTNEQLSSEVRALGTENDKLNRVVSNLESENNRLKEELSRQDTRVQQLEKTIEEFKDMEGVTDVEPIRPAYDRARQERVHREREIREEQAQTAQTGPSTQSPEPEEIPEE